MSTSKEETKITVKFLVDKQKMKVIFAEVDNDFMDTLFSFLTLPMGTIVRLLRDEKSDSRLFSLGSLSSLYQGIENLDPKYFWTDEYGKNVLLKSRNSLANECCKLKVNIDDTGPWRYFKCEDLKCNSRFSHRSVARCVCGKQMTQEIVPKDLEDSKGDGGFFTSITTFILSDDLRVMENSPSSCIDLLNESGIREMGDLEENTLSFGSKEFKCLLKSLLCSKTPLTDLFFGKFKDVNFAQVNLIIGDIDHMKTTTSVWKDTSLKLMVQKSTKNILFGVADEDFADFIFSFLTIPFGGLMYFLNGNTCLGSVDNLYKTILNPLVFCQLISTQLQTKLKSPGLYKNGIFSLSQEKTTNEFIYHSDNGSFYMTKPFLSYYSLYFSDPKFRGDKGFIRGPHLFMVTNDLVVTHLSSISTLSFLNHMKVPIDDVEEQVVNIGIAEALSILKASLLSKSALSNGLKPFLKIIKEEP